MHKIARAAAVGKSKRLTARFVSNLLDIFKRSTIKLILALVHEAAAKQEKQCFGQRSAANDSKVQMSDWSIYFDDT